MIASHALSAGCILVPTPRKTSRSEGRRGIHRVPSHAQALEARRERSVPKLKALQARLGADAATCTGTAMLLASQGTASDASVKWREQTVKPLCTVDKWPARVLDCVATADHDQLACTAYFETDAQRGHWAAAFTKWVETTK